MGEFLAKYGVLILGALNLIGVVAVWLSRKGVSRREFDTHLLRTSTLLPRNEFDTHVVRTEGRIKRLEEYHEDGPGWGAVNAAKEQIQELEGDVKALKVSIDAVKEKTADIGDAVGRIEQWLVEEKR